MTNVSNLVRSRVTGCGNSNSPATRKISRAAWHSLDRHQISQFVPNEARVKQINAQIEETTSDYEREKLRERLARSPVAFATGQ